MLYVQQKKHAGFAMASAANENKKNQKTGRCLLKYNKIDFKIRNTNLSLI